MKKIIVLLTFLIIVAWWVKTQKPAPIYLDNAKPILTHTEPDLVAAREAAARVNAKNSLIRTFSADVRIQKKAIALSGQIAYEKDRKFRMQSYNDKKSIFGQSKMELDIGSNPDYFWFWSARMKPPAVYYASYDHVNRNRLRTPFNPVWMMEILGLDEIDLNKGAVVLHKEVNQYKAWMCYEIRLSSSGEQIIKGTLYDDVKIKGHYLYTADGNLIISSEVMEFHNIEGIIVPKKIRTIWYEESLMLDWELANPTINQGLSVALWEMPEGRRIDITY